jgi:hypothetical protein
MGKAKKRGTRKQREVEAKKSARVNWDEQGQPVDPATFRFAFGIWCAAAARKMPVENRELMRIVDTVAGTEASLIDRPINRAGFAVSRQLREMGINNPLPYLIRLMSLQDLCDERNGVLADYFDQVDGQLMIADDLLTAAAQARFTIRFDDSDGGGPMGFDIADVLLKAQEAEMAVAVETPMLHAPATKS